MDIQTNISLAPGYVELTPDRIQNDCLQPNLNVTRI